PGELTVTGVGDRGEPDRNGELFCTVAGTVLGPGTDPEEVYGTLVVTEKMPWPSPGTTYPVVYRPGKVSTSWRFGELPPESGPV
ncbi:MAG: hypothetical protein QM662_10975, partial [Gordonia sp. (in: high G+C Gram-positive bacteria)]